MPEMTASEVCSIFNRIEPREDIAIARMQNADFAELESMRNLAYLRQLWRKFGVEPRREGWKP